MLIYSEKSTKRLQYAALVFCKHICKVDYQITSDQTYFKQYQETKINYSNDSSLGGVQITPASLLFEETIISQKIVFNQWQGLPVFFATQPDASIPFDILAASFYLLVRYEEYLPFEGDNHGRFSAQQSIAFEGEFLHLPIIDRWGMEFKILIREKYPNTSFGKKNFQVIATIDVDSAFAYKNKGFVRTLGGFVKDLMAFNFENFSYRWSVINNRQKDPYDTYDLLDQWHQQYDVPCKYFFLLADFGENDKNLPHTSQPLRKLIQDIAKRNQVCIHPGYQSNFKYQKLNTEINRLSSILGTDITHSRQHYLMLRFPETYRQLIQAGITNDYTLGYADYPGFRAGTCSAFPFFDLKANQTTTLVLHPFAVMDATLNRYQKLAPDEAIAAIQQLMDEVRKVNGTFISLWHNESLSEMGNWKDWRRVYLAMLKMKG